MGALPEGGLLTKLLQIFIFNFHGAWQRIVPDAQWLLLALFGISLVWAGVILAWRKELDLYPILYKAIIAIVFFWLIQNWGMVTTTVMKSFLGGGLKAGGDVITEVDFTNPDRIILHGFAATAVIFKSISDTSLLSVKSHAINLIAGIVAVFAVLAYAALAIVVVLSLLEFYANLPATLFLLPFILNDWTRSLTEKAIAHVFAACIRIFIIALVLSASLPLMVTASWAAADTMAVALYTLIVALALVGIVFMTNRWAQSLLHGSTAVSIQETTRQVHTLTRNVTQLTHTVQTFVDLLARTDPRHPSRQSITSGRRP